MAQIKLRGGARTSVVGLWQDGNSGEDLSQVRVERGNEVSSTVGGGMRDRLKAFFLLRLSNLR
jgi:hypothetical protein